MNELWTCAFAQSGSFLTDRFHPDMSIAVRKGEDAQIDGLIDSAPDLVLMEYKSGTLSAAAKYEGRLPILAKRCKRG